MADLVEEMARAIDSEAWEAIDDGRDVPGTFWHIRRDIARARAQGCLAVVEKRIEELTEAVEAAVYALRNNGFPDTADMLERAALPSVMLKTTIARHV